jgi:putative membrane protein
MNKKISAAVALASLAVTGVAFAQKVSDAQIAQIVVTANTIDIDNGKIALKNTKNASVDEFANLMIKDHTAVNNSAVALVTKLGVKPEDSDTNKSLKSAADTEQAKLKGLSGAAFDKEYLTNEVAYHKQVIGALDTVLIPNAQNAELKKTLVDVRPAFEAHLHHAEQALAALGK